MVGRLGFGEMTVRTGTTERTWFVDGGFVQVTGNVTSVLTNRALTPDRLDVAEAERKLSEASVIVPKSDAAFEAKEREQERRHPFLFGEQPRHVLGREPVAFRTTADHRVRLDAPTADLHLQVADQTIRSLFKFLQDRDEDRTRIMRRTNAAIESETKLIASATLNAWLYASSVLAASVTKPRMSLSRLLICDRALSAVAIAPLRTALAETNEVTTGESLLAGPPVVQHPRRKGFTVSVAVSRLALPHRSIEVDWQLYGPKLAQVALTFGADDLDGVSPSEEATEGRRRAPLEEVRRNIEAAGFEPVERDGRFTLCT